MTAPDPAAKEKAHAPTTPVPAKKKGDELTTKELDGVVGGTVRDVHRSAQRANDDSQHPLGPWPKAGTARSALHAHGRRVHGRSPPCRRARSAMAIAVMDTPNITHMGENAIIVEGARLPSTKPTIAAAPARHR